MTESSWNLLTSSASGRGLAGHQPRRRQSWGAQPSPPDWGGINRYDPTQLEGLGFENAAICDSSQPAISSFSIRFGRNFSIFSMKIPWFCLTFHAKNMPLHWASQAAEWAPRRIPTSPLRKKWGFHGGCHGNDLGNRWEIGFMGLVLGLMISEDFGAKIW